MTTLHRWLLLACVLSLTSGCALVNPGVLDELEANPDGPRAARTLVMSFADGTRLPLNYQREADVVYLGAGGSWWRRLETPTPVTVLIQGERLSGEAVAVRDDPARRRAVFRALRPRALAWLPGVLVKVTLTGEAPERALHSR